MILIGVTVVLILYAGTLMLFVEPGSDVLPLADPGHGAFVQAKNRYTLGIQWQVNHSLRCDLHYLINLHAKQRCSPLPIIIMRKPCITENSEIVAF